MYTHFGSSHFGSSTHIYICAHHKTMAMARILILALAAFSAEAATIAVCYVIVYYITAYNKQ